MPRIFISYRRDDSPAQAGRLYGELRDHFGKHAVYRDIDSMKPGDEFVDRIERELRSAAAVIAVIGDTWLNVDEPHGRRRLDMPNDYVRREIATALSQGKPVIPLLVNGAPMPGPDQLPEDIAPLALRNALELVDRYWKWGIRDLFEALEEIVGAPELDLGDGEREQARGDGAKAGEDLEAERIRFRRTEVVSQFLAERGVRPEDSVMAQLLKVRRDEPLLEALDAEIADWYMQVPSPLVATPTRLIYVVQAVRLKTYEYPYERLAKVSLTVGKGWDDSDLRTLIKRYDILLLGLQMYSGEPARFRLRHWRRDNVLSLLSAIHSRTEDGVVDLEGARTIAGQIPER
jgi:hypothetical protein